MSNLTKFINDQIENQNDYVKVVRCKECANATVVDGEIVCHILSGITGWLVTVKSDDFCSYGERKESE